jgi:hypothetical protein
MIIGVATNDSAGCEQEGAEMVWTIPLTEVAGVLAVSFTQGLPVMLAPADTPVQRPSRSPEIPAPAEPTEPQPTEPQPPELPPAESTAPSEPVPPAAVPAPAPVFPVATDDESAPILTQKEEKRGRVLRPTDRLRFFHMTAGGATPTGMSAYYGSYYGGGSSAMNFQIDAMIGAHARRHPEFGGAFVVQYRKAIGSEFSFAGRLLWDRPLSKSFAIYSSTDFTFGLNVAVGPDFTPGTPSALVGVGWGIKLVLLERLALSFRPIAPNLVAPDFYSPPVYVRFRWDVTAGIGVVW